MVDETMEKNVGEIGEKKDGKQNIPGEAGMFLFSRNFRK